MKHFLRVLSLVSCAAALVAVAPVAKADTISPTAPTLGSLVDSISGQVTSTSSVAGAKLFTVSYTASVYQDAMSGGLDFVYNIANIPATGDYIEAVSMSDFTGFLTGLVASGPGVAPTFATSGGGTVNFFFTDPTVNEGYDSQTLYILTNATNYTAGTFVAQDDSNAVLQGFEPVGTKSLPAPTPEPSSFVLLGSGLFAAAGMLRRRMTA